MSEKVPFTCKFCQQVFSVELPTSATINAGDYAMTVAKPEIFKCPNNKCGRLFKFILEKAAISWGALPVEQIEENKIILPRGGLSLVNR